MEWWILPRKNCEDLLSKILPDGEPNAIHVIEASKLKELQEASEILVKALEHIKTYSEEWPEYILCALKEFREKSPNP